MIHPKNIIYANKLRLLRKNAGEKQSYIAQVLGLKRQQEYSNLENGYLEFSSSIIEKICRHFKISKDEFLKIEGLPVKQILGLSDKESNKEKHDDFVPKSEVDWMELALLQKELEIAQLKLKTKSKKSGQVHSTSLTAPASIWVLI